VDGVAQGPAVVEQPQRGARLAARARGAQVGVDRVRVDEHTWVEHVVGVADGLDRAEEPQRLFVVHHRQQLGAGTTVAVLARERAAVLAQLLSTGQEELAEPAPPGVGVALPVGEVEVDAHVHAAVAEVAVGHTLQVVGAEQLVEVAQPGPEALGRHRGVLPPGVRRSPEAARGQPGPVLPDAPERRGLPGVGDHPVLQRRAGRDQRLLETGVGVLHEEPAAAAGQVGHRPATGPDEVDDAGVETLAGHQRTHRQQGRDGLGRLHHRRVAEHQQVPGDPVVDESHGRAEDDAQRALGADQELLDRATVLGEQVLQGVAADLAGEAAEVRPHVPEVGVHDPGQAVDDRRRPAAPHLAGAEGHVETEHVVRGAAVAQGAGAAGVVADHPADGAAGVRGRVGAEAQPVRCRGALQVGVHGSGLDHGGARLGIDRQHPVEVLGRVHDDARPDGVAGDGGARTAHGQRRTGRARHGQGGQQLVAVARPHDHLRGDAVERGVGGVQSPGQRGVVHVADAGRPQGCGQVLRGGPVLRGGHDAVPGR
jgi:hypothetical protein